MGEKKYNNPFYWQNKLDKNNLIEPITRQSVFCYEAFIDYRGESIVRWSCYPNAKAVLGYIQHIVMPTVYYSHIAGRDKRQFFTPDCSCNMLIEIFKNSKKYKIDTATLEIIVNENKFLMDLWTLDDKEIIKNLKDFEEEVADIWNNGLAYFTLFEIYTSPLEIFESTMNEYEESGALKQLESALGMTKEQWLDVCRQVYDNEFMQRKFIDILNNRLCRLM